MTLNHISCFLRLMQKLLFLIVFALTAGIRTEAASISGFILTDRDQFFFVPSDRNIKYQIKALTQGAIEGLKKLQSTDFVQGQGEFRDRELLLESIDFVGLRRLLGVWTAGAQSIFDFQDYSRVVVYKSFFNVMAQKARLQYTVAPSYGDDWRVFFTDENSVVLATLAFTGQHAVLQFIDVETGDYTKTIELTRDPRRN